MTKKLKKLSKKVYILKIRAILEMIWTWKDDNLVSKENLRISYKYNLILIYLFYMVLRNWTPNTK